jgi:hypothetical protein
MSPSEERSADLGEGSIEAQLEAMLRDSMTGHDAGQLQFDEVVEVLSRREGCTLVDLESKQEVNVYKGTGDETYPWYVGWSHYHQLPQSEVVMNALREGFQLRQFPPGNSPRCFQLYKNCHTHRVAASAALKLARMLPDVSPDRWLWVTCFDDDQRGDPPLPPSPWPPAGA